MRKPQSLRSASTAEEPCVRDLNARPSMATAPRRRWRDRSTRESSRRGAHRHADFARPRREVAANLGHRRVPTMGRPVEVQCTVDERGGRGHARMRHSRQAVLMVVLTLASFCARCAGLFNPSAERAVTVSGVVTNVGLESSCTLRLIRDNARLLGQLEVRPSFRRSFVIAPGKPLLYRVEVTCEGYSGGFRSQVVPLQRGHEHLDLGSVELR